MLNNSLLKRKLRASLIHLLLSIILVSLILSIVVIFWYPPEYLFVTIFKEIALLIISIDLILGPLLTFVAFNPAKKNLQFDLAIIATIQLSALFYGVHALYSAHPLYITYNHGRFNLIQANEINDTDIKNNNFKVSKISSPTLAFAQMPKDKKLQFEIMLGVDMRGEPDIDKRVEYYEPYEKHLDEILKNSLNTIEIFDDKNLTPSSKAFLKKYGQEKDKYAYLPLKGINANAIIVLDKKSAKVIDTIDANPWNFTKR